MILEEKESIKCLYHYIVDIKKYSALLSSMSRHQMDPSTYSSLHSLFTNNRIDNVTFDFFFQYLYINSLFTINVNEYADNLVVFMEDIYTKILKQNSIDYYLSLYLFIFLGVQSCKRIIDNEILLNNDNNKYIVSHTIKEVVG